MTASPSTGGRILRRVPSSELERRWALVRTHMAERGIEALVALAADDFLGGYVRWLSDRVATNAYNTVAIFHADAPLTMIEHGALGGRRAVRDDPEFDGAEDLFTTTSWRSVHGTHRNEAEIAIRVLRERGYRRVGLIGTGGMPHAFVAALVGMDIEIVDATDFVDHCKAEKSEVELAEVRAAAAMQDAVFARLLEQVQPGMRDFELAAIAQAEGRRLGSEQGVFLASSQALGKPTLLAPPHFQARMIERGDHVTVLIENNGPTGYYTELGRTIVFGKATPALLDATALAAEMQRAIVDRLRPGAACAEIAQAHDALMATHGLAPELRLLGHGQGYDLVERPLIRADETMTIEAGMNMAVHPSFVMAGAFGYVCDNFVVQADGAALPIHATPQQIFEL